MSTLHKVKAYFGMAPLEDYEDEYYDDDRAPSRGYERRVSASLTRTTTRDATTGTPSVVRAASTRARPTTSRVTAAVTPTTPGTAVANSTVPHRV